MSEVGGTEDLRRKVTFVPTTDAVSGVLSTQLLLLFTQLLLLFRIGAKDTRAAMSAWSVSGAPKFTGLVIGIGASAVMLNVCPFLANMRSQRLLVSSPGIFFLKEVPVPGV
jgi:hypothetical protein